MLNTNYVWTPVFAFGGHVIGEASPTFIIAEAACNHECDIDVAKRMIDAAHNIGADAIKFQTYKAEKLVTKDAMSYWGDKPKSQLEYYKQLDQFDREEYEALFGYAKEVGIMAFSTPFDVDSATMLAEIGVPLMKVASCEVTNLELVEHIASLKIPTIMSTGGRTSSEVIEAVSRFDGVPLLLMACTLSNPATEACLGRIHRLKDMYPGLHVGYSDHTEPDSQLVPMLAVAAGAKMIEKHFTIDKSMNISNHFFAADIHQFREMVHQIRQVEKHIGDYELLPVYEELAPRRSASRSWFTARPISKGKTFTRDDLVYLRPGEGLGYGRLGDILKSKAKTRFNAGVMLKEEDLDYEGV
jgi:sialic acid synthase SpsE